MAYIWCCKSLKIMDKIAQLKETYLRRIRIANEMIDKEDTPEEQKARLRVKVSCYKYFVIELEQ